MKIIDLFPKECKEYEFSFILNPAANVNECIEKVQYLFDRHIGMENIVSNWEVINDGQYQTVDGRFHALPKRQNRFHDFLLDHPCGDFPMNDAKIRKIRLN